MSRRRSHPWTQLSILLCLLLSGLVMPGQARVALADHTGAPTSVTLVGSLQSEVGCSGDWDPACAASALVYDSADEAWQASVDVPAGNWEYKAALNNGWDENYGANAQPGGANIALNLAAPATVKFYYDHDTHWVTSSRSARIVTAPGSYQSELGCTGDWQPDCLRSWLQDPDGDGTYTLETTALPAGSYETKATINEGWDENYGQGGAPNGANIGFSVPAGGAAVTLRFVSATNTLTIEVDQGAPGPDNNVEWDGLRHDSRDTIYRAPGGAAPAGTPVRIRFRTFHNDVTSVGLRVYDLNASAQSIVPMAIGVADVPCFQEGLEAERCDFWEATLRHDTPNNLWYRFVVSDGEDVDHYMDNTPALDGGLGKASDDAVDDSYALMFYDPDFRSPAWARNAVVYQIFPDRFRNGDRRNDPRTGDLRYDDPVLALPWGTLPEGYCRNYADGATNCPWRYDTTPPEDNPTREQPRGRDYYGGDLRGVTQRLDYLQSLGVTAIYFNPIFTARSNHRYDTADYKEIDPALGTLRDFRTLVQAARARGIHIILDGVYNHMSSDSAQFDRYRRYPTVGACESGASPYRGWFNFLAPTGDQPSPCAPSAPGGTDTYYRGWFGFDSIPEIRKTNPEVQRLFLTAPNSVSRYWLDEGARGWRLDVMGDASFPPGYWETFRQVVQDEDPEAIIIGELWQKDSTLLRHLRGQTADSTMNYRMRDAILGLLAPGSFDSKGFADSGRQISPSEFASRILSIREDYPDAAYYTLMNMVDSHDTERILWTLTPGAETRADREQNATHLAEGKRRLRITALIQFSMPGAPTVYYGDEAGVTGDDDPDDRRTYPWPDTGGRPDESLLRYYTDLGQLRDRYGVLANGDIRVLLADDDSDTVAIGRRSATAAAMLLVNRSSSPQNVRVPVEGFLSDGTRLVAIAGVENSLPGSIAVDNDGFVNVTLNPLSALLLHTRPGEDLRPPSKPRQLQVVSEGAGQVEIAWSRVFRADGYNVYRSLLSGGGYVKVNDEPLTSTSFVDTGLENARDYYYVVRAVDGAGNESADSAEVRATPHYEIGWSNLQWPPSIVHTISATQRTPNVYGQVWIDGVTDQPGATPSLLAELGFGPDGSDPAGAGWTWVEASFNSDAGNNDEYVASLLPEAIGTYDYAYRYSTDGGRTWLNADLSGSSDGYSPAAAGSLTVVASGDTTAPAAPTNLRVTAFGPAAIDLAWDGVSGDASLYGYEVLRAASSGGPYTQIARVSAGVNAYHDTSVVENTTYFYVVRALDTSFNRSGNSGEVSATALLRTVTLHITLTVPASTDGTGRSVHIAGFLDRLDGGLPQWDPAGVSLTRVSPTQWEITLTGKEGTEIEYKYTLGDWDHVEKGATCDELGNRMLTLTYDSDGVQDVGDIVLNWRNVAPCGN